MPWANVPAKALFARFVCEEQGQDLIEYALLALTVGIGAMTALSFLLSMMGGSYSQSLTNVGNQWVTPEPAGS
jgi:Flp pilus assembly pilin Flp